MDVNDSLPSTGATLRDLRVVHHIEGCNTMRVFKPVFSLLFGLALLTVLAPPAQAAVPWVPLTCGMVIQEDANVYLAEDLTCPDFGVRVQYDHAADVPATPHVLVDLRGHTLRGPGTDGPQGTGGGITAFSVGLDPSSVQVANGRLENWRIAVGGDGTFRTNKLALVGNRWAFFCSGSCAANRTYFGRSDVGFNVGADAGGRVTRSTFAHNKVGASVSGIWFLSVESSRFLANDVGVLANFAQVSVAKSLFVKNKAAIRVTSLDGDDSQCADLTKVRFVKNGVNVDGALCAA